MEKALLVANISGFILSLLVITLILFAIIALFSGDSTALQDSNESIMATTACGKTVSTLVDNFQMAPTEGKLGHEEHLTGVIGTHYVGPDSSPVTFAGGGGAFAPHTVDQERWYFNTQWGGWDWSPTRRKRAPRLDHSPGASEARKNVPHSRLIITNKANGKSMVASAEESGPALWVTDRDGVNTGAPPEVYNYLETSSPYTGNPNDDNGRITIGFAEDQNIPLGPCNKEDQQ